MPFGTQITQKYLHSLSDELVALDKDLSPPQSQYDEKEKIMKRISCLKSIGTLYTFGSCENGYWMKGSDIDACLLLENCNQRQSILSRLKYVRSLLYKQQFERVLLIPAKVPIVKIFDKNKKNVCDVSANNAAALENSRLVLALASIDPRTIVLGRCIKHWATSRQINNRAQGTLSTYTLLLQLFYFLMAKKKILPRYCDMEFDLSLEQHEKDIAQKMEYATSHATKTVSSVLNALELSERDEDTFDSPLFYMDVHKRQRGEEEGEKAEGQKAEGEGKDKKKKKDKKGEEREKKVGEGEKKAEEREKKGKKKRESGEEKEKEVVPTQEDIYKAYKELFYKEHFSANVNNGSNPLIAIPAVAEPTLHTINARDIDNKQLRLLRDRELFYSGGLWDDNTGTLRDLPFESDVKKLKVLMSGNGEENKESVGTLLKEFFEFYGGDEFSGGSEGYTLRIYDGSMEKNNEGVLIMRCPITKKNVNPFNVQTWRKIHAEFKRAKNMIQNQASFSIICTGKGQEVEMGEPPKKKKKRAASIAVAATVKQQIKEAKAKHEAAIQKN